MTLTVRKLKSGHLVTVRKLKSGDRDWRKTAKRKKTFHCCGSLFPFSFFFFFFLYRRNLPFDEIRKCIYIDRERHTTVNISRVVIIFLAGDSLLRGFTPATWPIVKTLARVSNYLRLLFVRAFTNAISVIISRMQIISGRPINPLSSVEKSRTTGE